MGVLLALMICGAFLYIILNDQDPVGGEYRCAHCRETVWRFSNRLWLTSFCSVTGRTVRLWRRW